MKSTFFHLEESKRQRVIEAAMAEFADKGFDRSSLDSIVRLARISKGGLYEYIDTKEDLFTYALEWSHERMRSHILTARPRNGFPPDPVVRARQIAAVAVEYYLRSPESIAFLGSAAGTENPAMRRCAREAFEAYFEGLFEDCDFSGFRFSKERVISILRWILEKTRNEFVETLNESGDAASCRAAYLAEWDFFCSAVTWGIYRSDADATRPEV